MSSAKWFKNLTAQHRTRDSALVVLASRAREVTHFLTIVAQGDTRDPEHVHQLRVATRRLGAALSIFRELMPPADHRRLKRVTRQIRRAAGTVRDLDVHRELLASRLRAAGTRGLSLDKVCDHGLMQRRANAERRLNHATHSALTVFSAAVARGLAGLNTASRDSQALQALGELARRTLRRRIKKLRSARSEQLHNFERLHQVRIAAKRLRYSMEIFAGCYPVAFRSIHYRTVEHIQEELGRINDLRSLARTVEEIAERRIPEERSDSRRSAPLTAQQFASRLKREAKLLRNRFLARWERTIKAKLRRLKLLIHRHSGESRIHMSSI
jgi:CHAD domain-containing protein